MKKYALLFLCLSTLNSLYAKAPIALESPDGKIKATITADKELAYEVEFNGSTVIAPSTATVTLSDGRTIGADPKISDIKRTSVNRMIASPFYRADSVSDHYNQVSMKVDRNWRITFRAYNDGVAYRWSTTDKKPFEIAGEGVEYRFPADGQAAVPFVKRNYDRIETQFFNSFENQYTQAPVSELDSKRLAFLPVVVEQPGKVKVCITESALENYPGLYLNVPDGKAAMKGVFAPYPKSLEQGGHNMLQMLVTERENYIAKVDGPRSFPWRIAIITGNDRDLAQSNLSYLLGEPSRIDDISWIKPGKVAWDWWNDWNLDGVDFVAGVNNDTYKAYIDFASKNGIEYVILDEGWAVNKKADLMQVVDEIDLKELVDYAAARNVGIVLWAGYYAFDRDMENVCRHYADMGVKGFKVDFMDRDDQQMTDFNYRAAATAAKYHLFLDLHGTHKPAGLNRTYPNVLNFEGVNGLEQLKWSAKPHDQVKYDVMIPFTRQVSGPMDYTQGAMRNATMKAYYPCNHEPMSQGTRCRQLALYMVYDSPFNMLCDTPSNYMREQECTDFIAEVPTVWDETRVLNADMGKYIVTARRSGDTWYIGGITDWTPRDITIDCSFLEPGAKYMATIFKDGMNAHKTARDYKRTTSTVSASDRPNLHMAPGGGFAIKLQKQ